MSATPLERLDRAKEKADSLGKILQREMARRWDKETRTWTDPETVAALHDAINDLLVIRNNIDFASRDLAKEV